MKKTLLLTTALSVALFTAAQAQTMTNASFETWHNVSPSSLALTAPDGWYGADSLVAGIAPLASVLANIDITAQKQLYKSTVAHSGSFSAEVKSAFLGDDVGNAPGIFANAQIGINLLGALGGTPEDILNYVSYTGGTSVTAQVDTVKAWVQLDSAVSMDNAMISVSAVKNVQASGGGDSTAIIGSGMYVVQRGNDSWVQVAVPVLYADAQVPEKLIVVFLSSDFNADTIHAGNGLKVDDVSYTYKSGGTSIVQPLMSENRMLVYPVPARNEVYFNLRADVKPGDFDLSVYDINGRLISAETLKQAVNTKDVSAWTKGNYIYRLTDRKSHQAEHGKFIVE